MAHTGVVTPIPGPDVRAELDRILASKGFATAGRLSKLLRYVVEKTLAGETDQLKEYAVGIEVFERDDKYDPRLDSIVRVEAGRLRTKLDEYYNGEGAASPIRISLPRGGYSARVLPVRERANAGRGCRQWPRHRRPRRSRAAIPLAAVLLMRDRRNGRSGSAAAIAVRGPTSGRPSAVLPFEANMIGERQQQLLRARLTEAVTSELARLGTLSVASHTSAMQFAGQRRPMCEIAAALKASYMVEASVDDEASEILVVARIVDAETDRKMWVSDYRGPRDDVRGIAQRIAFDVSAEILKRDAPGTALGT